jgi:hypothetical protein
MDQFTITNIPAETGTAHGVDLAERWQAVGVSLASFSNRIVAG